MRRIGHFDFVWANLAPIGLAGRGQSLRPGRPFLYVVSVAVWLLVLSRVEVSFAYPLLSVGYIVNAVAGTTCSRRTSRSPRVISGILIIIVGVYFVTRS